MKKDKKKIISNGKGKFLTEAEFWKSVPKLKDLKKKTSPENFDDGLTRVADSPTRQTKPVAKVNGDSLTRLKLDKCGIKTQETGDRENLSASKDEIVTPEFPIPCFGCDNVIKPNGFRYCEDCVLRMVESEVQEKDKEIGRLKFLLNNAEKQIEEKDKNLVNAKGFKLGWDCCKERIVGIIQSFIDREYPVFLYQHKDKVLQSLQSLLIRINSEVKEK